MKQKQIRNMLVFTLVTLMALSGTALGYRGMGMGDCPNAGKGYHHGRGGGNPCFAGDLNDDQIEKLNQERTAFMKDTAGLRADMKAKELELRAELAKQTPDKDKAMQLQKALSDLEAQFDQKRLAHRLKMKEINPDAGVMCGRGGYGRKGHGKGFGGGWR